MSFLVVSSLQQVIKLNVHVCFKSKFEHFLLSYMYSLIDISRKQ